MIRHKRYNAFGIIKENVLLSLFAVGLFSGLLSSCKKLVTVNAPANSVNTGNVFSNDATAIAAVTNIYAAISASSLPGGGVTSLSLFPGLSADELSLYSGATNNAVNYYYSNSLSSSNLNNPDFWTASYKIIFDANAAIEGLSASTGLAPAVKQQLSGETKFIRAFCYFYLVNLYGDVPLALSTDYTINASLSRTPRSKVYQQIMADLGEAEKQLSTTYLNGTLLGPTPERTRPTKWAASALLARVYLFTGDYTDAETEASSVLNNSSLFRMPSLNNVFLKNSNEAIWQLQPVNAGWNTEDARVFILPASGPNSTSYPVYLSPELLASFETGDQRRVNWIDSVNVNGSLYYYPFKYKSATYNNPVTEYETALRLSEQYLIRAEARVQQNLITGAQADLDTVRSRAGLPYTTANDKTSLLSAILHERQVELFTEWGHRWLDLKRTGNVDAVMSGVTPRKRGSWKTEWQWYPISRSELQLNHNLAQNAGY